MPSATRTIEIDAPPSVVMGVITDFAAYPSFLPEMKEARVVRHVGHEWEVAFALALIRDLHYTLRLVQSSPLAISWSLVDGAFQANDGRWVLEPRANGTRTFATYTIAIQVATHLPGSIVKGLVDLALPNTLERFKAEAERRARAS
jgi:ribosome-associated toxin RatA of RatAB toxin-antitoxin module